MTNPLANAATDDGFHRGRTAAAADGRNSGECCCRRLKVPARSFAPASSATADDRANGCRRVKMVEHPKKRRQRPDENSPGYFEAQSGSPSPPGGHSLRAREFIMSNKQHSRGRPRHRAGRRLVHEEQTEPASYAPSSSTVAMSAQYSMDMPNAEILVLHTRNAASSDLGIPKDSKTSSINPRAAPEGDRAARSKMMTPLTQLSARVAALLEKTRRSRGRLIFALDATASREAMWDMAARLQASMFQEAAAVGGLDVQLVYYRGTDECRFSRWTGDATSSPAR